MFDGQAAPFSLWEFGVFRLTFFDVHFYSGKKSKELSDVS